MLELKTNEIFKICYMNSIAHLMAQVSDVEEINRIYSI